MTHESPHDKAADAVHEGRPVEAQYVRQGRGGVRIMTLLLVSVAMVAVAFAIIWAFWAGPLSSSDTGNARAADEAAAFQTDTVEVPGADAPTTATGEATAPATGEAPNVNAPVVESNAPPQ